jgi:PAS domain S-box-containing protein
MSDGPIRILIVEDEVLVAGNMERKLLKFGYEVVGACSSAEAALEKMRESMPDIVIMDIRLDGETDGIDTAEVIERDYGVPVIFITAYADDGTIERAKRTKPYGYIVKPFSEQELKSNIEIALYRYRAEKEHKQREQQYRNAFRSMEEGIIVADRAMITRIVNPPLASLLGAEEESLEGLPLADLLPDARDHLDRLESGRRSVFFSRITPPGGERTEEMIVTGLPQYEEGGESITGFILLVTRFFAAEKEIFESVRGESALEEAVRTVSGPSILLRPNDSTVLLANKSFLSRFRCTEESILGKSAAKMAYWEDLTEVNKLLSFLEGKREGPVKVTLRNGEDEPVTCTAERSEVESDDEVYILVRFAPCRP